MKVLKSISVLTMVLLLTAGTVYAQGQMGQGQPQMPEIPTSDEVSDEELDRLVDTRIAMEPIEMEMQAEMQEAIEEEMDYERFRVIMMAMQNPQAAQEVEMTEEEQASIQALQPGLIQIQQEAQPKLIEVIESNGFEVERYQVLITAIQQDQELFERFEDKIESV